MGLVTKLTFAFALVILIVVLGSSSYSILSTLEENKQVSTKKVTLATKRLGLDFSRIQSVNKDFANRLVHEQAFINAVSSQNRETTASLVKTRIGQLGFAGFVTIVDEKGKVFYSSDTPNKYGYLIREKNAGIDYVLRNLDSFMGPTSGFTPSNTISLSSIVPIIGEAGKVLGALAINQPLDDEFFIGESTKFAILPESLTGIDFALLNGKDHSLSCLTPGLMHDPGNFVKLLEERGINALPDSPLNTPNWFSNLFHSFGFERDHHFWNQLNLTSVPSRGQGIPELVAVILVTTPIPDCTSKIVSSLFAWFAIGIIALIVGWLIAAWINKGVLTPLQILIKRTNELNNQRSTLTSNKGLQGDWLKLSEEIDNAFISLRSTVQSLKGQLGKLSTESQGKVQEQSTANNQFDALNRQVSNQAKQLSELSKQLNNATRQTILLQQELEAVLQSSTEGFLILDQYGNVINANSVFLNWMGVTQAEVAGRLCFDLVKKPGEPNNKNSGGRAFAKHSNDPQQLISQFYPEGVVYHKGQGKAVDVSAHLQPIGTHASIQNYIMVLRDKSTHKEPVLDQNEISKVLSQSVRNPLINAEASWQALLSSANQTMHPSFGQSLLELHSIYQRLLAGIDTLLKSYGNVAQLAPISQDSFPISRVVSECLEEVANTAKERQLLIDYKSVAGLPNIAGERDVIKATLKPLLEKMIAVTAPGGRVRVESTPKGTEMRIAVSSSGPSLSETEIADMFAGFIPEKHSEEEYSARLALYLARNNVERMSGKIWATTESGRGTVLYFTLPMNIS